MEKPVTRRLTRMLSEVLLKLQVWFFLARSRK